MAGSLLAIYCVLIVLSSVTGGWLPSLMRMTHLRTQLLMSFVAGLMLGIAMLHMLPHATELMNSAATTCGAALAGIIAMFILLRAFHTHAHHDIDADADHHGEEAQRDADEHEHAHHHDHEHSHTCRHDHDSGKHLGWLGMLFGLGLHTLMDGVALAASVAAEEHHTPWLGLAGLGTFLAVALHKPLDAFAITSVMRKGGWTPTQQSLVNMTFALACPVGALLFYLGATRLSGDGTILGWGLALSAGFFICISLSDLLPEVAFHDHDRLKLTTALLLGVALAVGIENLPGHSHEAHSRIPDVRDAIGEFQQGGHGSHDECARCALDAADPRAYKPSPMPSPKLSDNAPTFTARHDSHVVALVPCRRSCCVPTNDVYLTLSNTHGNDLY